MSIEAKNLMMDAVTVEQMKPNNIRVDLTPVSQLTPEDTTEVMNFMAVGYAHRWQGEENFRTNILANATEALRIYNNDQLAASLLLDNQRISIIAVDPEVRGLGLGIRLFEEAAKAHPDVWITVAVDAEEMMGTLTSDRLNYFPIETQDAIEGLFHSSNQGRDKFKITPEGQEIPLLGERLRAKRIDHTDSFFTYTREGGTHAAAGKYYPQMIFQNQPQVAQS